MAEDYEAQRLENLTHKQALLAQLNLDSSVIAKKTNVDAATTRPTKKRRLNPLTSTPSTPARTSARIASSSSRPSYPNDGEKQNAISPQQRSKTSQRRGIQRTPSAPANEDLRNAVPAKNTASIRAGWTSWTPTAPPPSRSSSGTFHFPDHPTFTPNKSPAEIMREGSFGGSYWRPLRSQTLGITISDDWRDLPPEWIAGLDVQRHLASPGYDASANKFGVACGQSIEAWEAAGWIAHEHDVRGWFQWYCRFFRGRRCKDDERQVGRWMRCAGPSGRWRRALLKRYVRAGVREVFDDGEEEEEEEEEEEKEEVSPVMHQTCHHWAFEVRQGDLDEFWRTGR